MREDFYFLFVYFFCLNFQSITLILKISVRLFVCGIYGTFCVFFFSVFKKLINVIHMKRFIVLSV